MKDNELRAIVLQKYYDLRQLGRFQWCEVELDNQFPIKEFKELARICDQLGEHNLIDWKPSLGGDGQPVGGIGKITAFGVDVVEGTTEAPIAITFHSQTVSVHGSPGANVNIGDGSIHQNGSWANYISGRIDKASASDSEKREAKSLLERVSENKLVNTILGAVVGEVTKAALPHKP
jgi:hypothetical protein